MSNEINSFTSTEASCSHRQDVNGMVGRWSTFNRIAYHFKENLRTYKSRQPFEIKGSGGL